MSTKRLKNKSLSEKISESFIPRPLNDPEYDSEDDTAPKLADIDEEDFEFGGESSKVFSDIRKRNVKLLSERSDKYKGKVSSRKELESDSHASSEQDSDEDDDGLKEYRNKLKNCQIDSEPDESLGTDEEAEEEEVAADSESEEEDSDYDSPGEDCSEESGDDDNEQGVVSAEGILKDTDNSADIQKGLAVQNQLKIWEKLLEVRIHSQKMLIKANSLPPPDKYDKIAEESEEFSILRQETQENVTKLLDKMVEMQTALSQQFPETKDLLRSSRKRQSTAPNEVPIKKFADLLKENFETLRPYRNSVLQKWHDRTKILTPGATGSKGRSSGSDNFDVVKKIETVLLNKSNLIKKSQQVKGNYQLFGQDLKQNEEQQQPMEEVEETTQENDEIKKENISYPEVYDDTDFYHQQLRELIEFKTNTSTNPQEMSRQFAELQKLRQKMKKKVDTRASKGRKVRYVVHNKLVNFMAPHNPSEWTDDSKNELYRSLFAT